MLLLKNNVDEFKTSKNNFSNKSILINVHKKYIQNPYCSIIRKKGCKKTSKIITKILTAEHKYNVISNVSVICNFCDIQRL